jgi:nucleotide-binding universal stress UspA family protein
MKVLIALDGSTGSFAAVDQVGRVLDRARDEIGLYCSPPEVRVATPHADPRLLGRAQEAVAEAIFEEARKRLPEPLQTRVRQIVGTQDPRSGIVTEAEAWNADLIAMGARGLTTLKRLLLGSVSSAVVHQTRIPVWVARAHPASDQYPSRVLLTCENAQCGRPLADMLARFTWPEQTRFVALSVVPSIVGRMPPWLEQQTRSPDIEAMVQIWAKEHQEERSRSQARLEEFVASLPEPLTKSKALVAEGEPTREILTTIQSEEIGLVVIGSQQKWSMATMILGSTSEAVLNHASCSVLVVPMASG